MNPVLQLRRGPQPHVRAKDACRLAYEALPLVYAWVRSGRPERILRFDGGIGDEFLCSALIREIRRRGAGRIWMLTDNPELFRNNPDVTLATRKNRAGVRRFLEMKRLETTALGYAAHVGGRDIPPSRHVITTLCMSQGLTGRITKRPYLHLTPGEESRGRLGPRQIAIQSSGLSARFAARTKEWYTDRFQQIVERYRGGHTFVQVGSAKDPALRGVVDLRGKTSIRETAAILRQSVLFVGLAGFLQHLARSVECRSVIIYGGRELPSQTGYTCNENVTESPACSPCWIYGTCDHGIKCMDAIGVDRVARAIDAQAGRFGLPLAVDIEDC